MTCDTPCYFAAEYLVNVEQVRLELVQVGSYFFCLPLDRHFFFSTHSLLYFCILLSILHRSDLNHKTTTEDKMSNLPSEPEFEQAYKGKSCTRSRCFTGIRR